MRGHVTMYLTTIPNYTVKENNTGFLREVVVIRIQTCDPGSLKGFPKPSQSQSRSFVNPTAPKGSSDSAHHRSDICAR